MPTWFWLPLWLCEVLDGSTGSRWCPRELTGMKPSKPRAAVTAVGLNPSMPASLLAKSGLILTTLAVGM